MDHALSGKAIKTGQRPNFCWMDGASQVQKILTVTKLVKVNVKLINFRKAESNFLFFEINQNKIDFFFTDSKLSTLCFT